MKKLIWSAAFLFLAGCTPTAQVDGTETGIRIMPLGDSITQADRNHNSYRRPLWFKLKQAGYNVNFVGSTRSHYLGNAPNSDFDQDHEGHWGWRVHQVLQQLDQWTERSKPDIVLVHLGTNDILSGESFESTIAELKELIQILRKRNPNVKIFLAKLIPSQNAEALTERFNQQVSKLAKSADSSTSPIILVDQSTGFAVSQDTYDGLHPNESGEQKMADRWFQSLQKVLQNNP